VGLAVVRDGSAGAGLSSGNRIEGVGYGMLITHAWAGL
jgi:hypothetical protein